MRRALLPKVLASSLALCVLALGWESLAKADRNYSIFLHRDRPDGTRVAQEDTYPGLGTRLTVYLMPGDTIAERHCLFLSPGSLAPAALKLAVGLYDLTDWRRLPGMGARGEHLPEEPVVASFVLKDRPSVPPNAVDALFAGGLRLLGFDFHRDGSLLFGSLWWRAEAALGTDYSEFIHVVAAPSPVPIAPWDGQPVGGNFPTSTWLPDLAFRESIQWRLPDAAPGDLRLWLGLYDLASGRRLLLEGGADHLEPGALPASSGPLLPSPGAR